MHKQYVIQWKSTVNGRAGRGTKVFEKAEAERLVEELNQEYPQIVHEVVEMSPAPQENTPEETAVGSPTMMLSIA